MSDLNQVLLMGRLGGDPVIRETKTGKKVTQFSLATSSYASDPEKRKTTWHRVVVWGKDAELCEQWLSKGSAVLIEGRIEKDRYTSSSGELKESTEVTASKVHFLPGVKKAEKEAEEEAQIEKAS
jgi:single-strand DNA-binding protein